MAIQEAIKWVLVCAVLFGGYCYIAEACDGYKVKLNKLELNKGSDLVGFRDHGVELKKDCKVYPKGCGTLKKPVKSCQILYDVKKRGMMVPFKGEKNMCEEIDKATKDPEVAKKFKEKNLDPRCPFPMINETCVEDDTNVDVNKYKDKFRLAAGQYQGTVTAKCDSGEVVIKFDAEFKRGK